MSTPGTGDPTHSTPLDRHNNGQGQNEPSSLDPSLGETLMEDIKNFLKTKHGVPPAAKEEHLASDGDSEEWTDEEEEEVEEDESTMREEQSIGKNWRERIAGKEKEKEMNKENRGERLEFSPPEKMPKNSPSYLIWSIFTKEREERRKRALQAKSPAGQVNPGAGQEVVPSKGALTVARSAPARPDSRVNQVQHPAKEDLDYQGTLLHMRVVELEHEIDSFKKETVKVQEIKKRLKTDREKLGAELKDFERLKTEDKKKLDEEKRRLKRDQLLVEKARKEVGGAKCEECSETKARMDALKEELSKVEATWRKEVARLEEELAKVKQSKLELENENGKLRLKKVGSKIRGRSRNVEVVSHRKSNDAEELDGGEGADSGFRTSAGSGSLQESEDDAMDAELRKSISSTIYAALCQEESVESPSLARRDYSTGSSLESSLTLVSATTATTEHDMAVVTDRERGTREKKFPDGRVEVWYSNGNRKEVSADKSVTKVFYYNGDVKESHKTGLVRYLYSQTKTWHTTHPDGKEVLQFSNGQEEVRLPDGTMTISFPDGSSKKINPGGEEEVTFPNGTKVAVKPGGDKVSNQLEVLTLNRCPITDIFSSLGMYFFLLSPSHYFERCFNYPMEKRRSIQECGRGGAILMAR